MKVGTRKVQNLLRAKKYEIGSGRKSTKFGPAKKSRNFGPAKSTKVGPAKFRPDMESTYRIRKYKS